jgi:phosphate transport system substrate-binding protein
LSGAGSTLVQPLEAEWAAVWDSVTGNTVDYAAIGSGRAYQEIAQGVIDFGASDAPLSAYSSPPCNRCVQIPWALTATGVGFHVNNIRRLQLTGPVIAAIYLGDIRNWDDRRIASLNRGLHLPNLRIRVFWRSDQSGDTWVFTRYLSRVSRAFARRVGSATTVSFPVGQGALGNTGMSQAMAQTNGAIAYVAVSYLVASRQPAAAIRNSAGRYEVPNLLNIESAASVVRNVPGNDEVTIVDPPAIAKVAYAISTFTYVIVPTNAAQGRVLKQFIEYALGAGQAFGPRLDFAPIPNNVLAAGRRTLNQISG